MIIHRGKLKIRTSLSIPLFTLLLSLFTFNFSLLTSSCQTAPKTYDSILDETKFLPLDAGAFAYIIADVQNAMPILNQSGLIKINTKQMQQMMDKTTSAMIAMYLPPSEKHFQVVSWGNYPSSRAKMALGFSRGWKKYRSKTSGEAYWYSAKEGISVALDKSQAWVLSSGGGIPIEPFSAAQGSAQGAGLSGNDDSTGTPVPETFMDFSRGAILSCWLNEPGPLINLRLQEMGFPLEIPAELIFASIYPAGEGQYQSLLRIYFASAAQARGVATVLSLARAFFAFSMPDASGGSAADGSAADGSAADGSAAGGSFEILQTIFFANPPVQDDKCLNIKTGILTSSGVALLFNLFSL